MLPAIRVDGMRFVDELGTPWPYVGVSDFALFKRWLMPNGPAALVTPRLAEWKQLAAEGGYTGPIVLRVFRFAAAWNIFGITDPWSYDFAQITAFTQFCEGQGFYVDWTCGDAQEILPSPDGPTGQQEHLNRTCAALVPTPNAFVETCNEPFKNGIDVSRVVPPQWGRYLRDSGAYGEVGSWPAGVNLDFGSYHGRRDDGPDRWPLWLIDMFAQASALPGAAGKAMPFVLKEPRRCDENGDSRPVDYERMGLLVAFTAGVTFHSQRGRDGDGFHDALIQRTCAVAFFRGVKAALALTPTP